MIVRNTTNRCIIVPTIVVDKYDEKEHVIVGDAAVCPPGHIEIPDALWASAREHAKAKIESGVLFEELILAPEGDAGKYAFSVPAKEKKDAGKVFVPAKFRDINKYGNHVQLVIKETFDVKTLNAWLEVEDRPDIRVELMKQISGIESGEIKG